MALTVYLVLLGVNLLGVVPAKIDIHVTFTARARPGISRFLRLRESAAVRINYHD